MGEMYHREGNGAPEKKIEAGREVMVDWPAVVNRTKSLPQPKEPTMSITAPEQLFTSEVLTRLFPADRADQFFDALLGDPSEGAYDIRLAFQRYDAKAKALAFALELHQRPGKCLACNLTYGLPEVFSRHPLINLKGVVAEIASLCDNATVKEWRLGTTQQVNKALHTVPLVINIA